MLARGLVAVSLAVSGASALTKNCRPESSTTLAIWPLVPGAKTVEQTISVARTSHAAFAVRFTIVPWGRPTTISNLLQSGQSLISPRPGQGQYPFGTRDPAEQSAEIARRWLILRIRARGGDCLPQDTVFWRSLDYNKGSRREGMLNKALFRAAVSFPPASAKSGRPPPEPPTCLANACISLPAWTLAVRSLVTPAIRATLPSSGIPSATTPEPSFCLKLSTSCLSPSRSTFSTSAAITLTPLTVCTRAASTSIWLSAPLRFC